MRCVSCSSWRCSQPLCLCTLCSPEGAVARSPTAASSQHRRGYFPMRLHDVVVRLLFRRARSASPNTPIKSRARALALEDEEEHMHAHATREMGGTRGRGGKGALQRGRVGAGGRWWWLERCAGQRPGWVAGGLTSSVIWRRGPDGGWYGTRPVDPVGGWVSHGLTDDLTSPIVSYSRANSVVRGGCYGARNAL